MTLLMTQSARRAVALPAVLTVLLLGACTNAQPEAAPTTGAAPSASPSPTPSPSASPGTSPGTSPGKERTDEPDPLGPGATNVLLVGTDSRDPASMGGNADAIMLAHVPADREQLYLVSFARDTWVPIPGLGEGKINSAFARGGTDTLADTVSGVLGGADVDAVMQANFDGFIALTRALDGFEVDNRHHTTLTVSSTGRVVDFPTGRITLENTDGLIYVRERKTMPLGDLDRAERQRAAVTGILDELAARADRPKQLAELVPLMAGNVKVGGDLQDLDLIDLVPLAADLEREDVVGLQVPITGFGTRGGASVNLLDEPRTADLGTALRDDAMDEYVQEHGTDYAPTSP